jgi:hypothetical protein
MQDLNTLVAAGAPYAITQAVAVNRRGVILAVGHGTAHGAPDHNDHETAFHVLLLIPSR